MTDLPNVYQAWAAVMADVTHLGKGEFHDSPQAKFHFRGVDGVMNAVGPALRKHGVAVIPTSVVANHRDVQTSTGKPSREATVQVAFTIYGPAGDFIVGEAPGESMDSGDKGTAKAMSVAYRTFLLQALTLPTQDKDPDATAYERATPEQAAKVGKAQELWGRATRAQTLDELRGLWQEATTAGLTGEELVLDAVSGERRPIAPAMKALREAMEAFEPPTGASAPPATEPFAPPPLSTGAGPDPIGPRMPTDRQTKTLHATLTNCGVAKPTERREILSVLLGRAVASQKDITAAEMGSLLELLAGVDKPEQLDALVATAAAGGGIDG